MGQGQTMALDLVSNREDGTSQARQAGRGTFPESEEGLRFPSDWGRRGRMTRLLTVPSPRSSRLERATTQRGALIVPWGVGFLDSAARLAQQASMALASAAVFAAGAAASGTEASTFAVAPASVVVLTTFTTGALAAGSSFFLGLGAWGGRLLDLPGRDFWPAELPAAQMRLQVLFEDRLWRGVRVFLRWVELWSISGWCLGRCARVPGLPPGLG